jgi:hypothetical protein
LAYFSIDYYDKHTGFIGKTRNTMLGENEVLEALREISKACVFSDKQVQDIFEKVNNIIQRKHRNAPTRTEPTLLDRTFSELEKNINNLVADNAWSLPINPPLKREKMPLPPTQFFSNSQNKKSEEILTDSVCTLETRI